MEVKTNIEKCLAGEWYDCHNQVFLALKTRTHKLLIYRLYFVDCNKITIGSNVLIAPNVQLYTATHPIDLDERLAPVETEDGIQRIRRTYALPITIKDGCWIGGGVVILSGITIGYGSVIGAGSIVTKDIPANSLAVGNPCKVIRQINQTKKP